MALGGVELRGSAGLGGRPLVVAGAAAAVVLGLVPVVVAVVGSGVGAEVGSGAAHRPIGWVLACCVLGVGLEGALLRAGRRRQRGVLVVAAVTGLAGGAAVWPFGAGLFAATVALAFVPGAIADVLGLSSRALWAPVVVFRVLVAVGLLVLLPATDSGAVALWSVAAAAAATALTIRALRRHPSRRAERQRDGAATATDQRCRSAR
ncbi:hypothetical protein [Cryptosporangium minutisporangium]